MAAILVGHPNFSSHIPIWCPSIWPANCGPHRFLFFHFHRFVPDPSHARATGRAPPPRTPPPPPPRPRGRHAAGRPSRRPSPADATPPATLAAAAGPPASGPPPRIRRRSRRRLLLAPLRFCASCSAVKFCQIISCVLLDRFDYPCEFSWSYSCANFSCRLRSTGHGGSNRPQTPPSSPRVKSKLSKCALDLHPFQKLLDVTCWGWGSCASV